MIELQYGTSGVYAIKNNKTGRLYIGSSKDVRLRKNHHLHFLRNEKHYNEELQKDWNEESFSFFLLEECSEEVLRDREQAWIDSSSNTYNLFMNDEMRKRVSEWMIGNKNGKGAIFTEERRRKIGEANKKALLGHVQGEETKKKRSESIKKWWAERKANGR